MQSNTEGNTTSNFTQRSYSKHSQNDKKILVADHNTKDLLGGQIKLNNQKLTDGQETNEILSPALTTSK